MQRTHCLAALAALVFATTISGCAHKTSTTTATSGETTTQASPAETTGPAATAIPAGSKTPVTLQISERATTTAGKPILRFAFAIQNRSQDPVLCDASVFSIQLSDGSSVPADSSAEYKCEPDTVDPGASGTATMFFDLPQSYTGAVVLIMTANDKVVGQVTTQIQ